jgi:ParB family chromosome partitioning protein
MVERKLGRGLDFFLPGGTAGAPAADELRQVEVGKLVPSPFQPRREFPERELAELADSIRSTGILQPVLVRKAGDRLEIVAGERRWRAAQLAGLERIPAIVQSLTDERAAVFSLVENLQRADLNAIEKAQAFVRLLELTKATQEELSRQVGLDRTSVANFIRLLELPEAVQRMVSRGTLSMGHARALLTLDPPEQLSIAERIVKDRLSVRQVETLVRDHMAKAPDANQPIRDGKGRPVWLNELEENLAEALGTSVRIRYGKKRSQIILECIGRDQFERVYSRLKSLSP